MTIHDVKILTAISITCAFCVLFAPNLAFAATLPGAPSGLTATVQDAINVFLSWTAGNGATSYRIDRAQGGGAFTTIVPDTGNAATTYTDRGLAKFTQYSYRVFSINGTGTSATPSNTATVTTSGSTVGCDGDCTPPTLGMDRGGVRMVDQGFSYNGNPVDVELFYTPYPLIQTKVGVPNKAVFKIFEDGGPDEVRHLDLAFGIASGQIISDSRARIEWDRSWDGTEKVTVIDPQNTLQNVRVETTLGPCKAEDVFKNDCLIVTIYHTFRAPLDFNIVGTNVWDEKRNAWQNYYNHGVEVIGESLNGPKQYLGIHHGKIIVLTETAKNKAVDEQGNTWTFDKEWIMDFVPKGKIVDPVSRYHGINREHAYFEIYKKGQILIAEYTLEEIMEKTRSVEQPYEKKTVHKLDTLDLATQKAVALELQKTKIYQ